MQNNEDIPIWLREASAAIIKHMNDDHSDVIVATLYGQHGIFDMEAEMTELETDGYYAVSRSGRYFWILMTIALAQKNTKKRW